MSRIPALSGIVRETGTDAMLLTGEVDLIYALRATALEGQCLIFADDTAIFITDGRYIESAEQMLEPQGFTVLQHPAAVTASAFVKQKLTERHVRKLLYEDAVLTMQEFAHWRKQLGLEMIPLADRIQKLRLCKSESEIASIVRAQRIAEKALERLLPELCTGMTEREAAARLNYYMALGGSEKPSFNTILLFGENTSKPHGVPSDRALRPGDFVLADFGAVYAGYHSDMTRTVAYGSASDEMRKVYETVLAAQSAAMNAAVAGNLCCNVHSAAADTISAAGFGEYFTHALGHGVGLEIHEKPFASLRCKDPLMDGIVLTDEPGIYMPGKFGVRIEDMLLIQGSNPRNLTEFPKEFTVLAEK